MIGQRIGRRRFFITVGPLIAVIGSAILYYLIRTPDLSLGAIIGTIGAAMGPETKDVDFH
jgi:hypothetical protein